MDWTEKIRLKHLSFLLSLQETNNLSLTAKALNTTQPGVSKWLKELESEMGVILFERHSRGMFPTRHGQVLIAHAKRIVSNLDRASKDMQALKEGAWAKVVIGTSGSAAASTLPHAVTLLMEEQADLNIELFEDTLDRLLPRLVQGELDLIVARTWEGALDVDVATEELFEEVLSVLARHDHPVFDLASIQWQDLLQYPWLLPTPDSTVRAAFDRSISLAGWAAPPHQIISNSVISNLAIARRSLALFTLSQRSGRSLFDLSRIREVPISLTHKEPITLYWRKNTIDSRSLALTKNALRRAAHLNQAALPPPT
ncbi:MAG: LysR family transcriptional regulator [Pigmentiphaga sp.]|nr:LysR family transcriptional regulator [Pigmentiphaga sp.]